MFREYSMADTFADFFFSVFHHDYVLTPNLLPEENMPMITITDAGIRNLINCWIFIRPMDLMRSQVL